MYEVLGDQRTDAGREFLAWIYSAKGRLVVGGKLMDELSKASGRFEDWAKDIWQAGKLQIVKPETISKGEAEIMKNKKLRSNDAHIIALALVSGARLLYSDDGALQDDFKDTALLPRPKGKIFPNGPKFRKARQRLLSSAKLCAEPKRFI